MIYFVRFEFCFLKINAKKKHYITRVLNPRFHGLEESVFLLYYWDMAINALLFLFLADYVYLCINVRLRKTFLSASKFGYLNKTHKITLCIKCSHCIIPK